MAFEGFSSRGNANATPSSIKRSLRPFKGLRGLSATDSSRPDPDDKGILPGGSHSCCCCLRCCPRWPCFSSSGARSYSDDHRGTEQQRLAYLTTSSLITSSTSSID